MNTRFKVNLNTFEVEEDTSVKNDLLSSTLLLNGVPIVSNINRQHDTNMLTFQIKEQIMKKNKIAIKRGLMMLYLMIHQQTVDTGYFYTHRTEASTPSSAKLYVRGLKCTIRATGKGLKISSVGPENREYLSIDDMKDAFKDDIASVKAFEDTFKGIESKVNSIMKNFK